MIEKLLIICLLLILAILTYFKIADHFNIIDRPNERSSHKQVTLRGGGVVFFVGVIFYFLFFGFQYPLFFTGLTIIAFISFVDDIKPVPSRYRIVIHFVSMLIMFYDCGFYYLPWYFSIIALIISTGIINAYNFMDGINGITGGYSLVVMGSFWYINNFNYPFIDNNLIYTISLSLFVFNFFNFRKKARCFAGDVGSVSIAFIILFLLGKLIVQTRDISYIIILLVYGVDSILTIAHRIILKENIFEAHRKHMYQIMSNELHIPQIYVSLIYMAVQAIVMSGYFAFKAFGTGYFIILAFVTGIIYIVFMRKYYILHLK
ncbi:MAG: hypothetical protein ACD_77C00103G0005 [uncultured bacterium]|nr:MAG: hypothetical protein ACD_77C00103G0005 [uncultured bacterium]